MMKLKRNLCKSLKKKSVETNGGSNGQWDCLQCLLEVRDEVAESLTKRWPGPAPKSN